MKRRPRKRTLLMLLLASGGGGAIILPGGAAGLAGFAFSFIAVVEYVAGVRASRAKEKFATALMGTPESVMSNSPALEITEPARRSE